MDLKENITFEFLSFIRFIEFDDIEILPKLMNYDNNDFDQRIHPNKTPPININNEIKMLNKIKKLTEQYLNK